MKLIELSEFIIERDFDNKTAYDFTVENDYTFKLANNIFVYDTSGVYKLHCKTSINELTNNIFIGNQLRNDHNTSFVHTYKSQLVLSLNIIIQSNNNIDRDAYTVIDNIQDVTIDYSDLDLYKSIKKDDHIISYGYCLLLKVIGLNEVKSIKNQQDLFEVINSVSSNSIEYHNKFSEVTKFLFWILSVNNKFNFTIPFDDSIQILRKYKNDSILNSLPINPYLGLYFYHLKIDEAINSLDKKSKLFLFTNSTKFRSQQFARSVLSIGYISNHHNIIKSNPIKSNLFVGLTEDEFFETSFGTRKGLIDKESIVPESGYLYRNLALGLSPIELDTDDCGAKIGFLITVKNKKHLNSLVGRYYRLNPIEDWRLLTKDNQELINNKIIIRSPITCINPNFKICKKCFGNYNVPTKYVGILSAQNIAERITQLSMNSFHNSGSANLALNPELYNYFKLNLISIQNNKNNSEIHLKEIPDYIVSLLESVPGFTNLDRVNNIASYDNLKKIPNEDVQRILKIINSLLKMENEKTGIESILTVYEKFINAILELTDIYSNFIEIILCNLYTNSDDKILRYQIKDNDKLYISKKYSIRRVLLIISEVLFLLYEPNKASCLNYSDIILKNISNKDTKDLSIFEKIWLDEL